VFYHLVVFELGLRLTSQLFEMLYYCN